MEIIISGDTVRTATVSKRNDGPEGPLLSFGSEIYVFGTDEDGDPIDVNIAVPTTAPSEKSKKHRVPSAKERLALAALDEVTLAEESRHRHRCSCRHLSAWFRLNFGGPSYWREVSSIAKPKTRELISAASR